MSNVIAPPDSPTEPVVKATIIPYKKNGVVICTLLNIKIMAYLNAVNVDIMLTKRHIITI